MFTDRATGRFGWDSSTTSSSSSKTRGISSMTFDKWLHPYLYKKVPFCIGYDEFKLDLA